MIYIYMVYILGDSAFHMYLILKGTFAYVARPERPSKSPRANELWPYQLFSHNSYFGNGELALQGGMKQPGALQYIVMRQETMI